MNEIALVGVVRCSRCARRGTESCPMRFEEVVEVNEYGESDHDIIVLDNTVDFGYCHLGFRDEMEGQE